MSTRSPATSSMSNRRSGGRLGGHPGVEDDLQQDVAELLAHRDRVVVDDRVVGLVRLLEQVAAQRGVRLLGVPRAAARASAAGPSPRRRRAAGRRPAPGRPRPTSARRPARRARPGRRRRRPGRPRRRRRARRSTVQPSARSAAAVAAAPGRAASGRPAGDRAPAGRAQQAGQTGADGDDERDGHPVSLRDARARALPGRGGGRRPRRRCRVVLEDVDDAAARRATSLPVLQDAVPRVHRDAEVLADVVDQRRARPASAASAASCSSCGPHLLEGGVDRARRRR